MDSISFSVKEQYVKDKQHNYIIDGWIGLCSWWDTVYDEVRVMKDDVKPIVISSETKAGCRKTVSEAIGRMRGELELAIAEGEDEEWAVHLFGDPPFVQKSGEVVDRAVRELTPRQMRIWLWVSWRKSWCKSRGARCTINPSLVSRAIGVTTTTAVSKDLEELNRMGYITAKRTGRRMSVEEVA